VAVVRMALAHQKVEFHGETLELPLPDGPGKVLKLTIRPAQEKIPIYLAVLGPKNVALAGEIADGWLPVFFSPEHTATLRAPLEEGAARAGRSLDDFRICPTVNVMIGDDASAARDAMRPMLSLYVGGMGSREQNFYNRLVSSYGFEEAAQQVQDLYLAGRKSEAAMALPDELIDAVSIVGPGDRAKERIKAFKVAGVDTLIVAPMALDNETRKQQLRLVAELAEEVG
jgi:F420-dependent oxidoreductase-like protein